MNLKNYTVRRYQKSDYQYWNTFVNQAKNATFLFNRDFMDYHNDRFEDYSLLAFENETLLAILPANRVGEIVYSHQGLTYGGLIYNQKLKLASVVLLFKAILFFLNQNKIAKIQIKTIPSIYHTQPAEELSYVLFLAKAQLIRRDTLAVIDLSRPFLITNDRKKGVKKAIAKGLIVKEVQEFENFWNEILIPNLKNKYNTKPVHTLQEIESLKSRFPQNIRQFEVYYKDKIIAGTTLFDTKNVIHSQYISADKTKNSNGSLDFLYNHLIANVFSHKCYFDFGISNENQGKTLNTGLSYWKESFGASTVVHDFYEVQTTNFLQLENVLQ
jgi:hypothetical protein